MISKDNTNKLVKLSIRDFNTTRLQQNCQPKQSCSKLCTPSCSSDQICVYKIITECGTCPPTHCIDKTPLQITVTNFESTNTSSTNDNRKTALIAGLTTGLVVLALIAVTIAGLVFYRRRKIQKLLLSQQQNDETLNYYNSSHYNNNTPTIPEMAILPPPSQISPKSESSFIRTPSINHRSQQVEEYIDYNHPQSPFIIGAQSLQIPHLDDITTTTTASIPDPAIRRSLNLAPSLPQLLSNNHLMIERSSSVKVTKYDHRSNIPTTTNLLDDLDDKVTIKRAVSVKKNNSTSSSITRVGSVSSQDIVMCAKPRIARINTISKREKGGVITRKTSIKRIVPSTTDGPFHVSLHDGPVVVSSQRDSTSTTSSSNDNAEGRIDFYLCPPPPALVDNNSSQISIQTSASSSSQSTLGDGSITVFWESPNTPH